MPEARDPRTQAIAERDRAVQTESVERTAQLVAANEQLVVSILQAQTAADDAARLIVQMQHLAERDVLTGLPNRLLMHDRFAQAIMQARRNETKLAILFVDLNGFKQVNDQRGHAVGDHVLQTVADCLVGAIRASDTVSRHGGDEFLVLLPEIASVADAIHTAHKIIAAIESPACMVTANQPLAASIGISVFPDDGDTVTALTDCADRAMYGAKRHGPGSFVYHGDAPALASLY